MARIDEEVVVVLSTSCTKDQAVMKLLGWSKGATFPKTNFTTYGVYSVDELSKTNHQTLDLREKLQETLEAARLLYIDALPEADYNEPYDFEANMAPEMLEDLIKKKEAVEEIREVIERAHNYALDIEDELEKGERSRLRIDSETTQRTGAVHITLRSLEKWQKEFYAPKQKFELNPDHQFELEPMPERLPEPVYVPESIPEPIIETVPDVPKLHSPVDGDFDLMAQLSRSVPENAKRVGDSDVSLYITLAFAVEAIAEKLGPPYAGKDEVPVISQIAELIAGKYQSQDGTPLFRGQGLEMIRKRLTLAMKLKPDLPKQP